jgi:hypothetical protein
MIESQNLHPEKDSVPLAYNLVDVTEDTVLDTLRVEDVKLTRSLQKN